MSGEIELDIDEIEARAERRLVDMTDAMRKATEPIDYLCRPLAARGFLTMLVGRPGEAKSWLMLAIAHAVDTGQEWVAGVTGMRCREGKALIVDGENGPILMARRFTDMGIGADGVVVADAAGLKLPDDGVELEALIGLTGPDLVVLDSLRRLAPGVREDKSDDIAPIMGELARIARQFDIALVVIHHRSTKLHAADVRGSDMAVCTATELPLAWNVRTARDNESIHALPLIDKASERGFAVETAAMDKAAGRERVRRPGRELGSSERRQHTS